MFYEAPFLSLLIFGFPFGVISIVFYFLCCLDSGEDQVEGELSDESDIDGDQEYYLDENDELELKRLEQQLETKEDEKVKKNK
jgi:hypothetical protein